MGHTEEKRRVDSIHPIQVRDKKGVVVNMVTKPRGTPNVRNLITGLKFA